jgi:hypothetical protein
MKKTINIYSHEGSYGENLIDVIECLRGILEQIPEEYRDTATVDIQSVSDWDSHMASIDICYCRPYTSEEIQEIDRRKKSEEAHRVEAEKTLYENLKKKFEQNPTPSTRVV